jgi:hypothetical protein
MRVLLEKLKKFLAFYGSRKFITVLTKSRQWSVPEPDASSPHLSTLTS